MPELPQARTLRFADIAQGERALFESELTEQRVADFAAFSGDYNPLHVDEQYAATSELGARIPHGMIAGALFSQLIGMHLPGRFSLYLSQTLIFRQPLPLSGTVVVEGEVLQKTDSMQTVRIATRVKDTAGTLLVEGEALVRVLK